MHPLLGQKGARAYHNGDSLDEPCLSTRYSGDASQTTLGKYPASAGPGGLGWASVVGGKTTWDGSVSNERWAASANVLLVHVAEQEQGQKSRDRCAFSDSDNVHKPRDLSST